MRYSLRVLLVGILGLTFGWTGAVVQARPDQQPDQTEIMQQTSKRMGKDALSAIEELDLSEEQQTEIDSIQAAMTDGLAEILTDEQMEELTTAQANGDDMRTVMRGLGLTSSQRSSVMSLMRDTQGQVMDVLTPEQRAQIERRTPARSLTALGRVLGMGTVNLYPKRLISS